ncbi:MAG: hypothetical protein H7321_06185, partial [Bacteroidia bacterium]|nr:hypothetical protein [Bacteroidia bacterium]
LLGEISASFIYKADDFEYAVITTTDGNLSIPDSVMDNLNSLSISTMRGIVFTTFKGTFLHNAYLPIIDPTAFRQKQ